MHSNSETVSTRHLFTNKKRTDIFDCDFISMDLNEFQDQFGDLILPVYVNDKFRGYSSIGEIDLMLASERGDYNFVKSLISEGSEVNQKERDGWTSLMLAVQNGHKDVVQLLLKHGANVNIRCRQGNTALMIAAQHGYTEITEILLQNKADINNRNENKVEAIFLASQNGHYDTVKLLLHYASEQSIVNDVGKQVSLYIAIQNGYDSIVELLCRYGVEISKSVVSSKWDIFEIEETDFKMNYFCVDKTGYSDLSSNVLREDMTLPPEYIPRTVSYKREHSFEINSMDISFFVNCNCPDENYILSDNWSEPSLGSLIELTSDYLSASEYLHVPLKVSPLMIASAKGFVRIIKILLDNGADIDEVDEWGKSSLVIAAGSGHVEAVELLLNRGANVNHTSRNGCTAVTISSFKGFVKVVEVLLIYKADVNVQLYDKVTALMLATQKNKIHIVELLLRNKADVNALQGENWSSLMIGSLLGFVEMVKLFIEHKAYANQTEKDGWSALMIACKQGHHEVVKVLLQNGANVNQEEMSYKMSSLSIASYENLPHIVETLLKYGAKVDHKTTHLWTPLMIACKKGHIEVVRCLLNYKPDINNSDENGVTALTLATQFNHAGIVELLCKNRASTKARTLRLFDCFRRNPSKHRDVDESVMRKSSEEAQSEIAPLGLIRPRSANHALNQDAGSEGAQAVAVQKLMAPIERQASETPHIENNYTFIVLNVKNVKQINMKKSENTMVQQVKNMANNKSILNVNKSSSHSEDDDTN